MFVLYMRLKEFNIDKLNSLVTLITYLILNEVVIYEYCKSIDYCDLTFSMFICIGRGFVISISYEDLSK